MRMSFASRQAGSLYLVALLALVLLLGAALTTLVVTQTEMLLGANERTLHGLLYAAESGISAAIARVLSTGERLPTTFELVSAGEPSLGYEIELSGLAEVLAAPCDLCELQASDYSEAPLARVAYAVTVRARLRPAGGLLWRGEKMLATILEVQPWRVSEATSPLDSAMLARIEL